MQVVGCFCLLYVCNKLYIKFDLPEHIWQKQQISRNPLNDFLTGSNTVHSETDVRREIVKFREHEI